MNEPHMAAWWFPANDHPRDKASFDIRITVPRGKDVVANGVLVSQAEAARPHHRALARGRADGAPTSRSSRPATSRRGR